MLPTSKRGSLSGTGAKPFWNILKRCHMCSPPPQWPADKDARVLQTLQAYCQQIGLDEFQYHAPGTGFSRGQRVTPPSVIICAYRLRAELRRQTEATFGPSPGRFHALRCLQSQRCRTVAYLPDSWRALCHFSENCSMPFIGSGLSPLGESPQRTDSAALLRFGALPSCPHTCGLPGKDNNLC